MSDDNSRWTTYRQDCYIGGTNFNKTYNIFKKYYRILYTNGSTIQTYFHLITYLRNTISNESENVHTDLINQNSHVDTTGNNKVVTPCTLLEMRSYSVGLTNNQLTITSKASSGVYTGTVTNSSINISVSNGTATTNGYYKSQSRRYAIYQPGKTVMTQATGILNNGNNTSGCTTRIGYYDDNDGLYFEYTNGISVNVRKNGTTTQILKANWNGDKLDGTGPSGLNLDFTKEQFFMIGFSWLGVGIIRFGFLIMGKFVICHTVTNYNILTSPFMNNPNLPIRYELTTATTSDYGSLLQGCATVISWGGYNPLGKSFSINTGTTGITATTSETPILAITGNSNYYHQNILIGTINMYNSSANTCLYNVRLYLAGNSPTSGTTTWNGDVGTNDSVVKYSVGTNILNGGSFQTTGSCILYSDYCVTKTNTGQIDLSNVFNNITQITSNIDNVCDIVVITCTGIGNNVTMFASMTWHEIY